MIVQPLCRTALSIFVFSDCITEFLKVSEQGVDLQSQVITGVSDSKWKINFDQLDSGKLDSIKKCAL